MIPRYTRPELTALWSESHRYETWLRVELSGYYAGIRLACRLSDVHLSATGA